MSEKVTQNNIESAIRELEHTTYYEGIVDEADAFQQGREFERERCATIAETSYQSTEQVGLEQFQQIRKKHGHLIAQRIRSGK